MRRLRTAKVYAMKLSELQTFVNRWKALQSENKSESTDDSVINISMWQEVFSGFSRLFQKALTSGDYVDLFGIDEIGRKEMRYSAVLAWMLDKSSDHGQGRIFFDAFLQYLDKKYPATERLCFTDSYTVRTEAPVDIKNRIDILIEDRTAVLIIEVKVDAHEHGNQLSSYAAWIERQAVKRGALVYLTRQGLRGSSEAALPVTWSDLSGCFVRVLKKLRKANASFSSSVSGKIVQQYCNRIADL